MCLERVDLFVELAHAILLSFHGPSLAENRVGDPPRHVCMHARYQTKLVAKQPVTLRPPIPPHASPNHRARNRRVGSGDDRLE
jgi:hypothetical protein